MTRMTRTSWNIRDSTTDALKELLKQKYKEINRSYEMMKKVSKKEDADRLVNEIWQMKSFASNIELELMRREYNNGTTS